MFAGVGWRLLPRPPSNLNPLPLFSLRGCSLVLLYPCTLVSFLCKGKGYKQATDYLLEAFLLFCVSYSCTVIMVLAHILLTGSRGCPLGDHRGLVLAVALNRPPDSVAPGAGPVNSRRLPPTDRAQSCCSSPMATESPQIAGRARPCWARHSALRDLSLSPSAPRCSDLKPPHSLKAHSLSGRAT